MTNTNATGITALANAAPLPIIAPLPTDADIQRALQTLELIVYWLDMGAPGNAREIALAQTNEMRARFR